MKTVFIFLIFLSLALLLADFSRSALLILRSRKLMRGAVPFQNINSDARTKILFIGDSTALGTGAETPDVSVAGYFYKDFPGAHIVNLGVNGNTTGKLAENFDPEEYDGYGLVVVHTGGNDILRFTRLKALEKDLEVLFIKIKKVTDQVVVLHSGNVGLAPLFPRIVAPLLTYRTTQVRDIFMKTAERNNVAYVDLFTNRANDPFLKDPKKFYAPDYLHPSGDGYKIWYEKIRQAMHEVGMQLNGNSR